MIRPELSSGGAGVWTPTAGSGLASHVTGDKYPFKHVAFVALGWNPVAHSIVHSSPLRIWVTPAPHGEPPPNPAALGTFTTRHGEIGLHSRGEKSPFVHVAVGGTALYPVSQVRVQIAPSLIDRIPVPHGSFPPAPAVPRPVPAALETMPTEHGKFGTQVTGSKVPLAHVAVATLGWNPAAHCVVHCSPLRIVEIPAPHGDTPPAPAALGTGTTVHGATNLHSRGEKTPFVHVAVAGTDL